jgi:hypothetical protein
MSIRQWPQKVLRRPIASFGLHSFARLKSTETELCFGLKGAFWRSDFGLEAIPDVEAWLAPSAPGGAKLLLRYRVTEDAEAQSSAKMFHQKILSIKCVNFNIIAK